MTLRRLFLCNVLGPLCDRCNTNCGELLSSFGSLLLHTALARPLALDLPVMEGRVAVVVGVIVVVVVVEVVVVPAPVSAEAVADGTSSARSGRAALVPRCERSSGTGLSVRGLGALSARYSPNSGIGIGMGMGMGMGIGIGYGTRTVTGGKIEGAWAKLAGDGACGFKEYEL